MRRFFLLAALCLSAWAVQAEKSGSLQSKQSDLDKIQERLEKKRSERAAAARRAEELSAQVDKASRDLRNARRGLKEINTQVSETERQRKQTEERLWAARLEMGQWEDIVARELRVYYQRQIFSSAQTLTELAWRKAALKDKAQGLAFAQEHHAQVETLRDELVSHETKMQRLKLDKEREEDRVAAAQKEMRSLYQTVQGRRAVLERDIRELQSSARQLQRLIANLLRQQDEARTRKGVGSRETLAQAARWRGRLPWPVEGRVVERFGRLKHPELDTYVFSNGVKLQSAPSATVRAVEQGEVVYAGEFMSYGLMALVQHPDNMHGVYAHLGRLAVSKGQKVAVGQSLGTAGQDDGGRPLAYFELRVGGQAVDPLLWLK